MIDTRDKTHEVCIDIETGAAPEKSWKHLIENWEPPGSIKDEAKIDARRCAHAGKVREKANLLNDSPIVCIGVGYMKDGEIRADVQSGLERDQLQWFTDWWNEYAAQTAMIVGHNILNFDLPKLRLAYIRHGMALPRWLSIMPGLKQPVFDTMREFRYISTEHSQDRFVSFNAVCHALRIDKHPDDIDGSEVQQYLDAGDLDKVIFHCRQDVQRELLAARLMMGLGMGDDSHDSVRAEQAEDNITRLF